MRLKIPKTVTSSCKSKDRQCNNQRKDKQRSTEHDANNEGLSNKTPLKSGGST